MRDFVSALKRTDKVVQSITPDLNHFEILLNLADTDGRLYREMMKLMRLT